MNITEETTTYGPRRPFQVLGKVFLGDESVGGGGTVPSTCPPVGAPTSITVHAVLTGSFVSGIECGEIDTEISADRTALCSDIGALWTVGVEDPQDCLNDCSAVEGATWICPGGCDTNDGVKATYGCTLIFHSATGRWELSPYFVLETPFCGTAIAINEAVAVDIGPDDPIGTHVVESSVGPSNPHVQWTITLA